MSRYVVFADWDVAPHLSEDAKAGLATSYMPHEREARMRGVPSLGAGAIYPVPEDDVICEPFEFPAWYRHAYGMDVGWNRTAAVWGALDPESDVFYLYSEHYRGQAEPAIHAASVRARGEWIPGVIDPASRGRGQADGEQLLNSYQNLGLGNLTTADNAVESGVYEVWSRLSTGRLRVFRTLQNWRMEFRIYRRDEKGKIVKENDHLMDATRYLCLSGIRRASQKPATMWRGSPGLPKPGNRGLEADYQPFADAYGAVGTQQRAQRQHWQGVGPWDRTP
jgi:hypothetical protein